MKDVNEKIQREIVQDTHEPIGLQLLNGGDVMIWQRGSGQHHVESKHIPSLISALQELSGKGAEGEFDMIAELKKQHYITFNYLKEQDYDGWNKYIANLLKTIQVVTHGIEPIKYPVSLITDHLNKLLQYANGDPTPPQREGEFAEWVSDNKWERNRNGETDNEWFHTIHGSILTTSELYKEFIKEK